MSNLDQKQPMSPQTIDFSSDHTYNPSSDKSPSNHHYQGNIKHSFKRRMLIHTNPPYSPKDIKDSAYWNSEGGKTIPTTETSPHKEALLINVYEQASPRGSYNYNDNDDGSLQSLKNIISQARKVESNHFENEDEDKHSLKNLGASRYLQDDFNDAAGVLDRVANKFNNGSKSGAEIELMEETEENDEHLTQAIETDILIEENSLEGLSHSKSSYIGGPVRYSKMPEEQAATVFEQRRKELLGTLMMKKGRKKKLRVFQEADAHGVRSPLGLETSSTCKEKSPVGFVVFNTRNPSINRTGKPESPILAPRKKSESKESAPRRLTGASINQTKQRSGPSIQVPDHPIMRRTEIESPQGMKNTSSVSTINTINTAVPSKTRYSDVFQEGAKKEGSIGNLENSKDRRSAKNSESIGKVTVDFQSLKAGKARGKRDIFGLPENSQLNKNKSRPKSPLKNNQQTGSSNSKPNVSRKHTGIWAEIEEIDHQIKGLEEVKLGVTQQKPNAIVNQMKEEWRRSNVHSKHNDDDDESHVQETTVETLVKEDQKSLSPWGHYEERRTSGKYKLATENLSIDDESINVYSETYKRSRHGMTDTSDFDRSSNLNETPVNLHSSYHSTTDSKKLLQMRRLEYLYQKGLEQKELRELQAENHRREKEIAELSQCTFSPLVQPHALEFQENFATRAKNWQVSKNKHLEDLERANNDKELSECTFFPNSSIHKSENSKFDSDEFYKKNIEWKRKIETEGCKRHEEMFKFLTVSTEKSKYSADDHKCRTTNPVISSHMRDSVKKLETPISGRSFSKKNLHEDKKSVEPRGNVYTQPCEDSYQTIRAQKMQKMRLHTAEDEGRGLPKRTEKRELRPEMPQSPDLFNMLRKTATKKDKHEGARTKGTSQSPSRLAKTPTHNPGMKFDNMILTPTAFSNSQKINFNTGKTRKLSGEAPFIYGDMKAKTLKVNAENIGTKDQRFNLSRKPKVIGTTNDQMTNQNKKETSAASAYNLRSPPMMTQPIRIPKNNENKVKQDSPRADQENRRFLHKPMNYKPEKQVNSPPNLFEDAYQQNSRPERSPLMDKDINALFTESHSEYVPKITSEEVKQSLEKRFLELITQVSKVTQQLEEIKQPGANSPSKDSISAKRRRMNFSLY